MQLLLEISYIPKSGARKWWRAGRNLEGRWGEGTEGQTEVQRGRNRERRREQNEPKERTTIKRDIRGIGCHDPHSQGHLQGLYLFQSPFTYAV